VDEEEAPAPRDPDAPVRVRTDEGGAVLAEVYKGTDGQIRVDGDGLVADCMRDQVAAGNAEHVRDLVRGYAYYWVERLEGPASQ